METKKEIRSRILKERRALSKNLWETYSRQITERITELTDFANAEIVLCYTDYNGEVGTKNIIEAAISYGKEVYVPKVLAPHKMEFYQIHSFEQLLPGAYGILEPSGNTKQFQGVCEGKQVLMIVPGVAFDKEKNRIGYGGGYYDCYLDRYPELPTVGIAFSLQLVDKVPSEATDRKVGQLITEDWRSA